MIYFLVGPTFTIHLDTLEFKQLGLSLNKHGFERGECWKPYTFERDNLMLEQLWGNVTSMEPLLYACVIPLMCVLSSLIAMLAQPS